MRNALMARPGRVFLVLLLAAVVALYLYGVEAESLTGLTSFFLEPGSNVLLFLLALLVLPLLGFPISAFCLMAGAKFGIAWGMAAIAGAMLFQQLVCFWLMHSYFRVRLQRLAERQAYRVPQLTRDQQFTWGVSVAAMPVFPYMVKNILLAAGQLSLGQYLLAAWPIQTLFSFPFVALTGAARERDILLITIASAGFIVIWLIFRWLQARRKR